MFKGFKITIIFQESPFGISWHFKKHSKGFIQLKLVMLRFVFKKENSNFHLEIILTIYLLNCTIIIYEKYFLRL